MSFDHLYDLMPLHHLLYRPVARRKRRQFTVLQTTRLYTSQACWHFSAKCMISSSHCVLMTWLSYPEVEGMVADCQFETVFQHFKVWNGTFGAQYLAQGHFDMWLGGARIRTIDLQITRRPAREQRPPQGQHGTISSCVFGDQNRYSEPKHDLFLNLTKWF